MYLPIKVSVHSLRCCSLQRPPYPSLLVACPQCRSTFARERGSIIAARNLVAKSSHIADGTDSVISISVTLSLVRLTRDRTEPLVAALTDFQNALSAEQKAKLLAANDAPDATAVLQFTAEIDRSNARRRSRCVASRLQKTLESVQQFTTIVDTFVSSSPAIAALVWGIFKVTILVGCVLC